MMKISYVYSTKAVVIYDGIFHTEVKGSLDEIVTDIIPKMHMYNFDTAVVTDAETGEVLIVIED